METTQTKNNEFIITQDINEKIQLLNPILLMKLMNNMREKMETFVITPFWNQPKERTQPTLLRNKRKPKEKKGT